MNSLEIQINSLLLNKFDEEDSDDSSSDGEDAEMTFVENNSVAASSRYDDDYDDDYHDDDDILDLHAELFHVGVDIPETSNVLSINGYSWYESQVKRESRRICREYRAQLKIIEQSSVLPPEMKNLQTEKLKTLVRIKFEVIMSYWNGKREEERALSERFMAFFDFTINERSSTNPEEHHIRKMIIIIRPYLVSSNVTDDDNEEERYDGIDERFEESMLDELSRISSSVDLSFLSTLFSLEEPKPRSRYLDAYLQCIFRLSSEEMNGDGSNLSMFCSDVVGYHHAGLIVGSFLDSCRKTHQYATSNANSCSDDMMYNIGCFRTSLARVLIERWQLMTGKIKDDLATSDNGLSSCAAVSTTSSKRSKRRGSFSSVCSGGSLDRSVSSGLFRRDSKNSVTNSVASSGTRKSAKSVVEMFSTEGGREATRIGPVSDVGRDRDCDRETLGSIDDSYDGSKDGNEASGNGKVSQPASSNAVAPDRRKQLLSNCYSLIELSITKLLWYLLYSDIKYLYKSVHREQDENCLTMLRRIASMPPINRRLSACQVSKQVKDRLDSHSLPGSNQYTSDPAFSKPLLLGSATRLILALSGCPADESTLHSVPSSGAKLSKGGLRIASVASDLLNQLKQGQHHSLEGNDHLSYAFSASGYDDFSNRICWLTKAVEFVSIDIVDICSMPTTVDRHFDLNDDGDSNGDVVPKTDDPLPSLQIAADDLLPIVQFLLVEVIKQLYVADVIQCTRVGWAVPLCSDMHALLQLLPERFQIRSEGYCLTTLLSALEVLAAESVSQPFETEDQDEEPMIDIIESQSVASNIKDSINKWMSGWSK